MNPTSSSVISADRLRDFGTRFRGPVFHPDASGYDEARHVWNGMVDRRPACIAMLLCYNGPADEGERVIKPLREFEPAVGGEVGPMPYTALQSMLDPGFPSGLQVYWRGEFIKQIPDALIDAAVGAYERVPSPLSAMLIEQFGGAVSRVPADAMAYDQRDSAYNLVIISRWADPADADKNIAWSRDVSAAARPHTTGRVYVNYIGVGENADRVRAAYTPDKYTKLAGIKKTYDPDNVFRVNQNIVPA